MKTAMYMRSPEPREKNGAGEQTKKDRNNETGSIDMQRAVLYSYLKSRKELPQSVEEYIDDGYSGADFNRPAFQRMLEDAKRGSIRTILVRDLQTFGTDYVTAGDYIEKIFPFLNVRFIAVGNSYDSRKVQEKKDNQQDRHPFFPLTAQDMMHAMYNRDLSEKIRNARKAAWNTGHSTSGHVPYGYVRNPEKKGAWQIDSEAAEVVRLMFALAGEGRNSAQIAHYLNDRHIPTPMVYNRTHNNWKDHSYVTKESERLWTAATVTPYLKRYEYTGALVIGRNRVIAEGSRKRRKLPEDEWTVVEDVHEAIITVEEFENAQAAIRNRKIPAYVNSRKYALKGKARCANCRCCLDFVDSGATPYYICGRKAAAGAESGCSGEKYPAEELNRAVYQALREYLEKNGKSMQTEEVLEQTGKSRKLTKELADEFITNVYVQDGEVVEIAFKIL